jgi:hypothetical protein
LGFRKIITLHTSNELISALAADSTAKKAQTNPWGHILHGFIGQHHRSIKFRSQLFSVGSDTTIFMK